MRQQRSKMVCVAAGLLILGLVATYFAIRPRAPISDGANSTPRGVLPGPTTDHVTALVTPRSGARVSEDRRRLDPRHDGWDP
ncbi:MAG: hypothetical protein IIA67_12955, partial [Planctomycetes bacterium]|nr:hypothetical protein [Planctomycetota bacterium]